MIETLLKSAEKLITRGEISLAVIKDGKIKTESARGISPLLQMYESGSLAGAVVVDKIIGMAAAKILVLGKAKSCKWLVMSRSALEYLRENGIFVEYTTLTEKIQNREGTGSCPMEEAVVGKDDPAEALIAIKQRLAELRKKRTNL